MAVSDPIADMLTIVRNAYSVKHENIVVRNSKINKEILRVLHVEGYISKFSVAKADKKPFSVLKVALKYDKNGNSVIHEIKKISKPGRRVYARYKNIGRERNGFGTIIVSTSHGVITDREARSKKVGGELICSVW